MWTGIIYWDKIRHARKTGDPHDRFWWRSLPNDAEVTTPVVLPRRLWTPEPSRGGNSTAPCFLHTTDPLPCRLLPRIFFLCATVTREMRAKMERVWCHPRWGDGPGLFTVRLGRATAVSSRWVRRDPLSSLMANHKNLGEPGALRLAAQL